MYVCVCMNVWMYHDRTLIRPPIYGRSYIEGLYVVVKNPKNITPRVISSITPRVIWEGKKRQLFKGPGQEGHRRYTLTSQGCESETRVTSHGVFTFQSRRSYIIYACVPPKISHTRYNEYVVPKMPHIRYWPRDIAWCIYSPESQVIHNI